MPMNVENAYKILELTLNDSLEKVHKSFRKLALIKHPDKNKDDPTATKTFIKIQQAYKYLVNFKRSNSNDQPQFENSREIQQLPPNEVYLPLTLEEMFTGCVKEVKITRKKINVGTRKIEDEEKTLLVQIQAGVLTGSRIVIKNEGDCHVGTIPANVVFIVNEQPHEQFRRSRFNLEYTAQIHTEDAFLGEIEIPTLQNNFIKLEIDEYITVNTTKKIVGQGFPIPGKGERHGDLIVKFEIIYDPDLPQDPPLERNLFLSLEQIVTGCRKNVKIKRKVTDDNGTERFEEFSLNINVQPGSEVGQTFQFYKKGDKRPETIPADIIFVIKYRRHPLFKLNGADIEYVCKLTQSEANASGVVCEIPTLEAEKLQITINELITNETTKVFLGYGLPHSDNPENRGELVVRFTILSNFSIDPPIEYTLRLSIKQIFNGISKRVKIKRKIFDDEGEQLTFDNILIIDVQPGTEMGAKFIFPRQGDSYLDSIEADIIFIVAEKAHDQFRRIGADIEYIARISQSLFALGQPIPVPTLGKQVLNVHLDDIFKPSTAVRRFIGQGLPKLNDANSRGDLIICFDVIESKQLQPIKRNLYLTEEQLRNGCNNLIKLTRTITDVNGIQETKSENVNINIEPGTVDGQQFSFSQMDDKLPGQIPEDVIFTVRCKLQDPPVNYKIEIPLENYFTGITKRLKINRKIIDVEGNEQVDSKIVFIEIKPGMEAGTQFTFPREGDRIFNRVPANIIFTILDKTNEIFVRKGTNIEFSVDITQDRVKDGFEIEIPTLEGNPMLKSFSPNQVRPNYIHRIHGRGLPFPHNSNMRGDLIVRFTVLNI